MTKTKIGLAVSGGADSMYLMHLCAAHKHLYDYIVLTVNHGLRRESAEEVLFVQNEAAKLNFDTQILHITEPAPETGIQNFARQQRYALLAETGQKLGISKILTGHHKDDMRETVLSRLMKASGIAGLCGMYDVFYHHNMRFERPLLNRERYHIEQKLQKYPYITDPSNFSDKYERTHSRQFLNENPTLKPRLDHITMQARAAHYPTLERRNIFLRTHAYFSPYGYVELPREQYEAERKA